MTTGEKQLLLLFFSVATVRFFTETHPVLPHALQFIDFLLLPLFAVAFLFRLCSTPSVPLRAGSWLVLSVVFLLMSALSILANRRDIYGPAALLFIAGHLVPIAYAWIAMNWPMHEEAFARRFVTAMIVFGVLQIATAVTEVPRYLREIAVGTESDAFSGTYGFNSDQLAVVLCLPVLLLLERRLARVGKRRELLLMIVFLALVYVASLKALWVLFPLTILMLFIVLGRREVIRLAGLSILFAGALVFSVTKLAPAWTGAFERLAQPQLILQQGKVQTLLRIPLVMSQRPWGPLIGIGPGSFCSRGFRTFAAIDEGNAGGDDRSVTASLRANYLPPIAAKYLILPRQDAGFGAFGSIKTAGPFTSYASLLIESGLIGAGAIFAIYLMTFWQLRKIYRRAVRAGDGELRALAFAAAGGLLLLAQMSILDNYLELTRVTIAVWTFVVAALVRARVTQPVTQRVRARREASGVLVPARSESR